MKTPVATRNTTLLSSIRQLVKDSERFASAPDRRAYVPRTEKRRCLTLVDGIIKLASFRRCVEELHADSIISAHLGHAVRISGGWQSYNEEKILGTFLDRVYNWHDWRVVGEAKIDESYRSMEDYFYSSNICREVLFEIHGLKLAKEVERIELEASTEIVRYSQERLSHLYWLGVLAPIVGGPPRSIFPDPWRDTFLSFSWSEPKMIVEIPSDERAQTPPYENEKDITDFLDVARETMEAIRLHSDGWCTLGPAYRLAHTFFDVGSRSSISGPTFRTRGRDVVIEPAHVASLCEMWKDYRSVRGRFPNFLEFSVRRFGTAYERRDLDDALVDFVICAEALFLGNDISDTKERGELKFRLALRGSLLLGDSPPSRELVFNKLRNYYDLRSSIVHGGKPVWEGKTQHEKEDCIEELASLMRAAVNATWRQVASWQREGIRANWTAFWKRLYFGAGEE